MKETVALKHTKTVEKPEQPQVGQNEDVVPVRRKKGLCVNTGIRAGARC